MDPILTDEKTGIMYREWKAEDPKAVLLLVHGMGASTERWEFMGLFFAANSISSYGLELKGFGKAEGQRGYISSFDVYIRDIKSLYEIIKKRNPGRKVFLAGESMGGLIAFLIAGSGRIAFDGFVCISPAFASRLKFSFFEYFNMLFSFFFRPMKYFHMHFDQNMCTRDENYRQTMDISSVYNRLVTAKLIGEIFIAEEKAIHIKSAVKMPALFLIAGEDKIVDPAASRSVFRDIGSRDKGMIVYPEMYHALSVELGREKVFEDLLDWLRKRI